MTLHTWLLFCMTETVLCLIPGPAVLFVVSAAIGRGVRPGINATLGILAGNIVYFALSATGVAAVLVASSSLFNLLKLAGAGYLIWLGVRMLLTRAGEPAAVVASTVRQTFLRGFLVQTANPKALIFFVALLPQFINPEYAVGLQILLLGASSVLIEFCVLGVYVLLGARARQVAGAHLAGPIERIGGSFLVAVGAHLALFRSE
jgi:homoserine/homoserine lactone efflux protein